MESRCKASVIMASTRSGGGVGLRGSGVQVLGYRGLLVVALLFVTVTMFEINDVHCSITTDAVAPAPTPSTEQTQPIVRFHQYEADALNAVFQIWSKQNPQFSTLFNWSLEQHPCNNLTGAFEKRTGNDFQGAWNGVGCTSEVRNLTEIPKQYQISVTSLEIFGSNSSCSRYSDYNQCGFDGIIGQLPLEISNLTNLQTILIGNNPKLTGPVPIEIFKLPYLVRLYLHNNSLNGTLPSDVYNVDCELEYLNLRKNNFSGRLRVSSQGTLFCSSLFLLDLRFNQLDGPIDFQDWNATTTPILYLSNNHFKGTFSTGPYFDAFSIDLSNNDLSSLQLANYIGPIQYTNSSPVRMPSLYDLNISSNNFNTLFPEEIFGMSSLQYLDLSMNNFFGSIDFGGLNTSIELEYLYFQNNSLKGQFPAHILTVPSLNIFLGGNPICDKIENPTLSTTCRFS